MNNLELVILYFVLAIFMYGVSFKLIYKTRCQVRKYLGLIFLSTGIWNMFLGFHVATTSYNLKIIFHELKYIGISTLPIHLFFFVISYTKFSSKVNFKKLRLLYIVPIISMMIIMTNNCHHLFRKDIWVGTIGMTKVVLAKNAVGFYMLTGYAYFLYILSLVFVVGAIINTPSVYRRKYYSVIFGILFPFVVNVIYNQQGMNSNFYDPTPIALTVTVLVMLFAIKEKDVFDTKPVARNLVFKHINTPIIVIDSSGIVLDLNDSAINLFDIDIKAVIAKKIELIDPILNEIDDDKKLIIEDKVFLVERTYFGDEDDMSSFILVFNDVTVQENYTKKLEYLSFHDNLTGAYNNNFLSTISEKISSEENLPLGIILGDLNGLKVINDSYGHSSGDFVLKEAVKGMKKCLGENDILVRLGGDEFLILIPNLESEEIMMNKSEHITSISIPMKDKIATISVGTSIMKETDQSFEATIKEADFNMYKEKSAYKNNNHILKK